MNKRFKKRLGVESVKVARVLPGDIVVIKCNRVLSSEDKRITCEQGAKLFPNNNVVVLDATCNIEIKRNENNV